MAIMKTCCCCGVRSGSNACGIYSLTISILGILLFVWDLVYLPTYKDLLYKIEEEYPGVLDNLNIDAYICAEKALYICGIVFLGSVFLTSIVLLYGIRENYKGPLIPFIVAKTIGLLWYVFAFAVNIYAMVSLGMAYAGASVLSFLIVLGPFLITDVVCVLCVFSQYQEYRDERLRQSPGIVQAPVPATGSFGYHPMQEPPPAYTKKM